jgi:HemY protein
MKRALVVIVIVIVGVGWIGTLVARDPGYVLISYDGATIQTGFWVLLGAIVALVVGGFYLLKLLGVVAKSATYYRRWQGDRQRRKSMELTQKGLAFLQEGSFDRALKFLVSGAANNDSPGINYISAAQAADYLGNAELREQNLRLARESGSGVELAATVAEAQMCSQKGDWLKCIACLDGAPNNSVVLDLKKKALVQLRSWQALSDLMPALRKAATDKEVHRAFEKHVALQRFSAPGNTNEGAAIIYKKLTDELKKDKDVVVAFCDAVTDEMEIELVLRNALKIQWQEQLVIKYGQATRETVTKRLKVAEGWLKEHTDDYATHLCLAQLYELGGQKDRAMSSYQRSISIRETRQGNERLAFLLAFEGDYKKSSELLRTALSLTDIKSLT